MEKSEIINEVVSTLDGILQSNEIQNARDAMERNDNASYYGANGSLVTALFYIKAQVAISGGKTFDGNGGGLYSIGGGGAWGNVYTDDIERLYRETVSFQVNATPAYVNINFFNSHSQLLGHFQSGALSVSAGVGGVTGKWV